MDLEDKDLRNKVMTLVEDLEQLLAIKKNGWTVELLSLMNLAYFIARDAGMDPDVYEYILWCFGEKLRKEREPYV